MVISCRFSRSVFKYICLTAFFSFFLFLNSCVPVEIQTSPTDSPPPETSSPEPVIEVTEEPPEPVVEVTVEPEPPAVPVFSPNLSTAEPVEDDFFKDAAFVGNSLMDGFRLHSGITAGDFYAYTSMTVMGVGVKRVVDMGDDSKVTILEGMAERQYGKIYTLFGINEIYLEAAEFAVHYGSMIEKLREIQPEADIYIMSLTPLGKEKSQGSPTYNLENVLAFNDALYELADEKNCYYLDVYSALADEDGFLPDGDSTDGVHLTPSYYRLWLEYVRSHYVCKEAGI